MREQLSATPALLGSGALPVLSQLTRVVQPRNACTLSSPTTRGKSQYAISCPTQVVPACLESSGLLDSAITALLNPYSLEEPQAMGQMVAVHVLGGALSLSKGRTLFSRLPPAAAPAHSSGMVC